MKRIWAHILRHKKKYSGATLLVTGAIAANNPKYSTFITDLMTVLFM